MQHLTFQTYWRNARLLLIIACLICAYQVRAQSQDGPCDPGTLSYSVDLSGQPDGIFESPLDSRTGLCCGADFPDRCVQFFIRLDKNARGLKFDIARGAVPPGSLFYQIDCGPIVKVGEPICLEGGKDYILTFCKPGNNPNAYFIESIPGALIPDTVRTQVNCPVEIRVSGLEVATLKWRDVSTSQGKFSRYLNCTSRCDRVIAVPDEDAERFIRYEVCGTVSAENCPLTYEVCDTVVLEVLPTPRTTLRVDICEGFSYEWRGRTFTNTGLFTDTLVSALGCDSLVSLDLKVNPSRKGQLEATICPGEVFELAGKKFREAGVYDITLTDSINCDSIITLNLEVLPGAAPVIEGGDLLCNGSTLDLKLTESFSSYRWSTGETEREITVLSGGVYSVTVTSANGCTAPVSFTVKEAPSLDASISGGGMLTCEDQSVLIRSAAYTDPDAAGVLLQWLDRRGRVVGDGPSLRTRQPGRYYLRVSDPSGICTATDSIQITRSAEVPGFTLSSSGELNCRTDEAILSVEIDDNVANPNIRWTGPGILSGSLSLPVNQPGWYFMEVTNPDNGCVTLDSIFVASNLQSPGILLEDESLLRCDEEQITLEGMTTIPDPVYEWRTTEGQFSGPANQPRVTVQRPGWYFLEVTDNDNGCSSLDSVRVTAPDDISSVDLNVKASCSNDPGGVIEVTAIEGGITPYRYFLNGEQENGTGLFTGLPPGNYGLEVIDGFGCSAERTISVEAIEVQTTSETVTLCEGLTYDWNGRQLGMEGIYTDTLTALSGCDSIITLDLRINQSKVRVTQRASICPGASYEVGGQFFSDPGTYNIVLAGTTACDSIIILELSHFPVEAPGIQAPPVLCEGETAELSIDRSYAEYQWSDGTSGPVLLADSGGDYSVTVTDANGCVAEAGFFLPESEVPAARAAGDSTITCTRSFARLKADSSLIGFTLSWYNPRGSLIGEGPTLIATEPGNYILRASDETGTCSSTDTVAVEVSQEVPELILSIPEEITCQRPEVELPAETPNGGDDLAVRWNGPGIVEGANTFTPTVNRTGLYRIVVTDTLTGCFTSGTLRVREDRQPPLIALSGSPRLDCITGETVLQAQSPDPTVNYLWRTEEGIINGATDGRQVIAAEAGWYDLLATDIETGCTTEERVFVDYPDAPRDAVVRAVPTCENESKGYVIVDRIEGGIAPFSYSLNGAPADARGSYTDLNPGVYQLDIIDEAGCSFTTFSEVESLPAPQTVMRVDICEGLTYTWKGREYIQTGMYVDTFLAVNGCDSLDILDLRVNPAEQLEMQVRICQGEFYQIGGQSITEPGNYTIAIPDSVVCESVVRLDLEVTPVDSLTIQGPTTFCEGETIRLEAEGNFSSFEWSNGNNGPVTDIRAGGFYTVTAITPEGCVRTADLVIEEKLSPIANILGNNILNCEDSEFTLTADRYDPSLEWTWMDQGMTPVGSGQSLGISSPGDYFLEVRDPVNGCTGTDSIRVEEGRVFPEIGLSAADALTCLAPEINLEVVLSSGYSGSANILWSGPGILAGQTTLQPRIGQPGMYTVFVTDTESGCVSSDSISVSDSRIPPPTVLSDSAGLDCNTGGVVVNAATGTPGMSYEWITAGGQLSGNTSQAEISITMPGLYIVEVRDEETGCIARDSIMVMDTDGPRGVEVDIDPSCSDVNTGALIVSGVEGGLPPYVFSLNDRPYSDLDTFNNIAAGVYGFEIEDAAGCLWDTTLVVPEVPPIVVDLDVDLEIRLGDSVYLLPSVNIPRSEMAQINWSPATGLSCTDCLDPTATPAISTEYTLEIVDIYGCRGADLARIAVDDRPPIYVPDGFSPNGDGINDRFTVFSSDRIKRVRELRIFSRWGEMVFHQEDFPPNEPGYGWDGTLDGRPMNPAVFVYYTVVELFNGREVVVKGDLTLMR